MSMNFMGLGFNFGAKDAGLEKMQKGVTAGFDLMASGVWKFQSATVPAFDVVDRALGGLADVMEGQTKNALPAWMQAWGSSVRGVGAGMDGLGEKQGFFNQAFVDGAEKVSAAWSKTFGHSFKALGHFQ